MSMALNASLAVIETLAGSPSALAQDKPNQAFLKKAIEGNLAELAVGKLAQEKGNALARRLRP